MILKNFGKNETRKPLVHKGYILDKIVILFSIVFFVVLTNILAYAAGYSDGEQNCASHVEKNDATTSLITETTTATSTGTEITETCTEVETTVTAVTTQSTEASEIKTQKVIYQNIEWTDSLYSFVEEVASYYGYDPEIILKVIYVESRFNCSATNGDYTGLMQVSEYYAPSYKEWNDKYDALINYYEWDLTNPEINIIIGTRMLKSWESCSSNLVENLCHYNSGYEYEDTFYGELVLSVEL